MNIHGGGAVGELAHGDEVDSGGGHPGQAFGVDGAGGL